MAKETAAEPSCDLVRVLGRNPVGVGELLRVTQGRRGAPTLGSWTKRRWRWAPVVSSRRPRSGRRMSNLQSPGSPGPPPPGATPRWRPATAIRPLRPESPSRHGTTPPRRCPGHHVIPGPRKIQPQRPRDSLSPHTPPRSMLSIHSFHPIRARRRGRSGRVRRTGIRGA